MKRFLADVYGEVSYSDLKYDKKLGYNQAQATAEQVMDYLKNSRFYVSEDYPEEMAYKITVVRYAMSENSYQKYIATTIASDVSEESVAYVSENASKLQGVEVIDDTIRKYNDAEYFASIIGSTGKISTEEYESLSADNGNYTLTDVVGKAGTNEHRREDFSWIICSSNNTCIHKTVLSDIITRIKTGICIYYLCNFIILNNTF